MTVRDYTQDVLNAVIAIVEADSEVQALCAGRTSNIFVPWNDLALDKVIPQIAYHLVTSAEAISNAPMGSERMEYQFSVFAGSKVVAGKLATQLPLALTWTAFNAHELDCIVDGIPDRTEPPHDPVANSPAKARVDVHVTLLLTK